MKPITSAVTFMVDNLTDPVARLGTRPNGNVFYRTRGGLLYEFDENQIAVLDRFKFTIRLTPELAGMPPDPAPTMEARQTFVIPDGYEPVRDAEGRATGEVRPIAASEDLGEAPRAEIYLDQVGRFQARFGEIRKTGHSITEDSGVFMVRSISAQGGILVSDATRAAAEILIAKEWLQVAAARVPETSRDLDRRFQATPIEARMAELQLRNLLAAKALRPLLNSGDRIRANKAECNAREASFTFSHWDGGWIISNGGSSISPASIYSINGKVLKV